ncbi:triose-phosphate isomerase family protein [Agromyces marinus]|uniref:Triosephosphate isomerase n=1 Tax=Agromyces marinus TaxID=1389020 RepID=A0ABN6YF10_9MICO|nr:triose-phosphate isomerase family protein [Agromyces marinus]UIP57386.1 L-erythrulose-1-phosphate isomerase [Agromyces marinus]BDZ54500.1 triosephosphate isomerase [Agromyces marinus]
MSPRVSVGVSLKMYFGHADARRWFEHVAASAAAHPAVVDGRVECFVIPTYLQVLPALAAFEGTPVVVGAQDVATEDSGAYTGEVSAAELAEVGVGLAEIGHAERRRLFGETDEVVAAKAAAALRNGIAPVLCIGESERADAASAAADTIAQLRSALADAPAGRVLVAYEPVWAIGAPEPAPASHIAEVSRALRTEIDALPGREGSLVIYGGSAGPGQLTRLDGSVDGLFLGRFAHDPAALADVLDEAALLADRRAEAAA